MNLIIIFLMPMVLNFTSQVMLLQRKHKLNQQIMIPLKAFNYPKYKYLNRINQIRQPQANSEQREKMLYYFSERNTINLQNVDAQKQQVYFDKSKFFLPFFENKLQDRNENKMQSSATVNQIQSLRTINSKENLFVQNNLKITGFKPSNRNNIQNKEEFEKYLFKQNRIRKYSKKNKKIIFTNVYRISQILYQTLRKIPENLKLKTEDEKALIKDFGQISQIYSNSDNDYQIAQNKYHFIQSKQQQQVQIKKYQIQFNSSIKLSEPSKNLKLKKQSRMLASSFSPIDYVINGNFSSNTCSYSFCVWTTSTFLASKLPGWNPDPEIQIGKITSYFFTSNVTKYVIDMIAYSATCIKQSITNLPRGVYQFKYTYRARLDSNFSNCKIIAYLNSSEVDRDTPTNVNSINRTISNITIAVNNSSIQVKICGDTNDLNSTRGALLQSVSFINIAELPILNTTNSTNSTSNFNNSATNSSNTTFANSTINLNLTVADPINSTLNSTVNSTGNSVQFFENNMTSETQQESNILFQFLMKLTINNPIFDVIFKIPGSRRFLKNYFYFFINIDHLWLYIYHNRSYSKYVKQILISIRRLEQQKWDIFNKQIIEKAFHFSIYDIQQQIDVKAEYTSKPFYEIQATGSQFLVNSLMFFIINLPLTLLTFILGKIMLMVFKKGLIHSRLQEFSINTSLILMILEGNSQSFTYYFTQDASTLFSRKWSTKLFNFLTIMLFQFFTFTLINQYFFIRLQQGPKSRKIHQNCKSTLPGLVFLLISYGLLNFTLGSIHSIFQKDPNNQLLILLIVQVAYVISLITSLKLYSTIYQYKYLVWVLIISSCLRIILIFTYQIFQKADEAGINQIQQVQLALLIIYLTIWILCIFISIGLTLKNILKYLILNASSICQAKNKNKDKISLFKQQKFQKNKSIRFVIQAIGFQLETLRKRNKQHQKQTNLSKNYKSIASKALLEDQALIKFKREEQFFNQILFNSQKKKKLRGNQFNQIDLSDQKINLQQKQKQGKLTPKLQFQKSRPSFTNSRKIRGQKERLNSYKNAIKFKFRLIECSFHKG